MGRRSVIIDWHNSHKFLINHSLTLSSQFPLWSPLLINFSVTDLKTPKFTIIIVLLATTQNARTTSHHTLMTTELLRVSEKWKTTIEIVHRPSQSYLVNDTAKAAAGERSSRALLYDITKASFVESPQPEALRSFLASLTSLLFSVSLSCLYVCV